MNTVVIRFFDCGQEVMNKEQEQRIERKKPPGVGGFGWRVYLRHLLIQYLSNTEIKKLVAAPIAAITAVLITSAAVMLTSNTVIKPPAVPILADAIYV